MKINNIHHFPTADGHMGIIAGKYHHARTPRELLKRARELYPQLKFELE